MEENKQKVKLKGKLQTYLIWPMLMMVLFAFMTSGILIINLRAGVIALTASLIYAICVVALYFKVRK